MLGDLFKVQKIVSKM